MKTRSRFKRWFLTGADKGEVQNRTGEQVFAVFVPITPNPTSGFLLYVPESDTIPLDMCVEDGMKCVIPAGVISPAWSPPPTIT